MMITHAVTSNESVRGNILKIDWH